MSDPQGLLSHGVLQQNCTPEMIGKALPSGIVLQVVNRSPNQLTGEDMVNFVVSDGSHGVVATMEKTAFTQSLGKLRDLYAGSVIVVHRSSFTSEANGRAALFISSFHALGCWYSVIGNPDPFQRLRLEAGGPINLNKPATGDGGSIPKPSLPDLNIGLESSKAEDKPSSSRAAGLESSKAEGIQSSSAGTFDDEEEQEQEEH